MYVICTSDNVRRQPCYFSDASLLVSDASLSCTLCAFLYVDVRLYLPCQFFGFDVRHCEHPRRSGTKTGISLWWRLLGTQGFEDLQNLGRSRCFQLPQTIFNDPVRVRVMQ